MIGWIKALHILSIILGLVFIKAGIIVYGSISGYVLFVLGLILMGLGVHGFIYINAKKRSIREAETDLESRHNDEDK